MARKKNPNPELIVAARNSLVSERNAIDATDNAIRAALAGGWSLAKIGKKIGMSETALRNRRDRDLNYPWNEVGAEAETAEPETVEQASESADAAWAEAVERLKRKPSMPAKPESKESSAIKVATLQSGEKIAPQNGGGLSALLAAKRAESAAGGK